jgi:RNA polymerase sigma factor (sigma-70 family)
VTLYVAVAPSDSPDTFETWYRAAHPRILAAMCALCGDAEAARESADEAFSRCYSSWDRVRDMDSPLGWTFRVAQNCLRRSIRRREMERRLLLRRGRGEGVLDQCFVEAREMLDRLSARQRTAMVLRYVIDLPEAEVAAAMHISRGTVASTLFDARRRLSGPGDRPETEEARTDV